MNSLKQKNAVQTCISQKYGRNDFQSRMYPQRHHKNVSLQICAHLAQNYLEKKSNPESRVTKLITHVFTLQTEIVMLKEDNCRSQRI